MIGSDRMGPLHLKDAGTWSGSQQVWKDLSCTLVYVSQVVVPIRIVFALVRVSFKVEADQKKV